MKKILAILLAMTLVASCLTACGNSSSNADESKAEDSSSEVETTTTTISDSSSEEETTTTTTTAETTTTTEETTTTTASETEAATTTTTQATTRATTRATTKATTKTTTKATTKATTKTPSKTNNVIYSDSNVTITYTGYDPNGSIFGGKMYYTIQNKSKHKLWICTQDVVIDGCTVDSNTFFTGPRVMAGTRFSDCVIVDKRGLESSGLNLLKIKIIELSFRIYNVDPGTSVLEDFYDTKRVRITI